MLNEVHGSADGIIIDDEVTFQEHFKGEQRSDSIDKIFIYTSKKRHQLDNISIMEFVDFLRMDF